MKTNSSFPRNGALSGMILTAIAAAVAVPLALFSDTFREKMSHPLSYSSLKWFFISIMLMILHKVESYYMKEFNHCPVYLTNGEAEWAKNPRQTIFIAFVSTFLGMLIATFFVFMGPPWHLVLLIVWLGQGLHEFHHVAKSFSRGKVYPGTYTSIAFVCAVSFGLFPAWFQIVFKERNFFYYAYYAILPVVFYAFYREDKIWYKKALLFGRFRDLLKDDSHETWEETRSENT